MIISNDIKTSTNTFITRRTLIVLQVLVLQNENDYFCGVFRNTWPYGLPPTEKST